MTNETKNEQMIHFFIDDIEVAVPQGTTVYHAAKQMGIDIPIFCYHDRMPPFGACRMCLVQVDKMAKPQTSCTLEASEGMIVHTQSEMALSSRKEMIEFLLLNHPLDCPICDRGGECPLQDNAMRCGSGKSRFYEQKRHFKKPLALGPVLMLDRERCIVCARCTRFSDLVSGDHALEFIERGYKTEVGTSQGKPVDSKFIGNTIMICPVGALTSQVYRFRARPWDNEPTKSTCTLCPVGCSMILDSRDGEIMRTRSAEDPNVNDIWLCDKGWFGYEFTYHADRLKSPLLKRQGELTPVSWDEALNVIVERIEAAKPSGKLAAFGGLPLTFEENYLFQQLMRQGMGSNHVDSRMGLSIIQPEDEGIAPGMESSIAECETLTYVLLLGLDLTEEFPVIWLRLRQAINKGAVVYYSGYHTPEIAPYFSKVIIHMPGEELQAIAKLGQDISTLASKGVGAVMVGSQYLANPSRKAILSQVLQWQQKEHGLSLHIMEGKGNSMGARLAGMHPDFGPYGQKIPSPGMNALQVLQAAAQGDWGFLYVVGCNPALQVPTDLWQKARQNLGCLVVQDIFLTETAKQADIVLPTLCYTEKEGSFVNIEGRVQQLLPGKEIPEGLLADGEIFALIAKQLGIHLSYPIDLQNHLSNGIYRLPRQSKWASEPVQHIPGKLGERSLFAVFARKLFDHGTRMRHDPHLIQMSIEPKAKIHPEEGTRLQIKNGMVVRISCNERSIQCKIVLDSSVAKRTIVFPLGFANDIPVQELGDNLFNGMQVEMEDIHV